MKMESSKSNNPDPMEMLFRARWNVPKAAVALGISSEECKEVFRAYLKKRLQSES
jgi:hypothetical protein